MSQLIRTFVTIFIFEEKSPLLTIFIFASNVDLRIDCGARCQTKCT